MENTLPKGLQSWKETYFEVVAFMSSELYKETPDSALIEETYLQNGRYGLYNLAEKLTNEFEELHKDTFFDGEFFDEVDAFMKQKLYNEEEK